jgi:hypothetical protein
VLFDKLGGQLVGVGLEDAAKLSKVGLKSLCGGNGGKNGVLKRLGYLMSFNSIG